MSSFWKNQPFLVQALGRVKTRLIRLADSFPGSLRTEIFPFLNQEGKSLRAGLLLLSASTKRNGISDYFQRDRQSRIEAAAAAVETLHLATLIHDDVLDQATLRRGEPSLYARFGSQKSILYGDLLLSACFNLITQEVSEQSSRALSLVTATMVCSELLQYNDRFQTRFSVRSALRKMLGKTALLFSLCMYVGAFEAGKPDWVCSRLRRAGYALGMAFQMQDDLLDWLGNSRNLGKPILEDIRNGIYNWPVVVAWKSNPEETIRQLKAVDAKKLNPEELVEVWKGRNIWNQIECDIQRYLGRAKNDIKSVLEPEEVEQWYSVIDQLVKRKV